MGQKKQRIENPDLIEEVKTFPCIACNGPGGDPHHCTTRGAGGGDTWDNLMPLCREHHVLIHKVGWKKAIEIRPGIGIWLEQAGRIDILDRMKR